MPVRRSITVLAAVGVASAGILVPTSTAAAHAEDDAPLLLSRTVYTADANSAHRMMIMPSPAVPAHFTRFSLPLWTLAGEVSTCCREGNWHDVTP